MQRSASHTYYMRGRSCWGSGIPPRAPHYEEACHWTLGDRAAAFRRPESWGCLEGRGVLGSYVEEVDRPQKLSLRSLSPPQLTQDFFLLPVGTDFLTIGADHK